MTVLGISGCTALILTGFGIKDSIEIIVTDQYGTLFRYDMSIVTEADLSEAKLNKLKEDVSGFKEIKDVEIFNRSPIRTPRRFHILVGSRESVVSPMDGSATVTKSGHGVKALEHQIAIIVKRASAYATEICVHSIVSTLYVIGYIVERLARIVYLRGFREQVQITRSQQSRT
mgnify:CR=1 FL=1